MSLNIKTVRSTNDFNALENEWNELYDKTNVSIFNSFDWMKVWWETFGGPDFKLNIILFYDDSSLVGIAPLVIKTTKKRFGISVRSLQFLGTGEPTEADVCSELLDFIVLPGYENKVNFLFTSTSVDNSRWDTIEFKETIPDSFVSSYIIRAFEGKVWRHIYETRKTPSEFFNYSTTLPKTWEEYEALLRKSVKRRMWKDKKQMCKTSYTTDYLVLEKDADKMFDELKRLHDIRWANDNGGAFQDHRFVDFHRKVIAKLLPKGKVILKTMSSDEKSFAALYGFVDKKHFFYYQTGMDSSASKLKSPGSLNIFDSIETAIETGIETFDFLKSEKDTYKDKTFACNSQAVYNVTVYKKVGFSKWLSRAQKLRVLFIKSANIPATQGAA